MKVGTILLTQANEYVAQDGVTLPARPDFDKEFLTEFLAGHKVSAEGEQLLPPSIKKVLGRKSALPVTIRELASADLLIVIKSRQLRFYYPGKKFRFDEFKRILKTEEIEIWKHL